MIISPANTSLKHILQLVEHGLYLVEVKLKYSVGESLVFHILKVLRFWNVIGSPQLGNSQCANLEFVIYFQWKQIDADYCLFICAIGDPIIGVANLDYRHGEWQPWQERKVYTYFCNQLLQQLSTLITELVEYLSQAGLTAEIYYKQIIIYQETFLS